MSRARRATLAGMLAVGMLAALAACSDDGSNGGRVSLTLVAYDSFPAEGTPLNVALAEFSEQSNIDVTIVQAGDTGTMVTKAGLTAGNPEGDVMWGVDNTFLSAATAAGIFEGDPTAVDFADVCVDYDIAWFDEHDLAPPASLQDLTEPAYKGLLVVEDPSKSSPGLAFLLATIADGGEDGWSQYWEALKDNDVSVAASWDEAYYERFTAAGGTADPRPMVVSYGSDPAADVIFADPPRGTTNVGVIASTCLRQTEYAGILRGTDHADEAQQLVEFLTGERFQKELPETLFVYPANTAVALPATFQQLAVVPDQPLEVSAADIAANRERWLDEWNQILFG